MTSVYLYCGPDFWHVALSGSQFTQCSIQFPYFHYVGVSAFSHSPSLPVLLSHLRLHCREQGSVSLLLHAIAKVFSLIGHPTWGGCVFTGYVYIQLVKIYNGQSLHLWNKCTHQPSDGHSLILGMAKLASKQNKYCFHC